MEAAAAANVQKYGVPIYAAGWVPRAALLRLRSSSKAEEEKEKEKKEEVKEEEEEEKEEETGKEEEEEYYVVLVGGGGEGRSGIPNAVLLSRFDPASNSLSSQPVARLGLGSDLPYRMAVHPAGDGIVCGLPKSCQFYEWDEIEEDGKTKLVPRISERVLIQLEDVEQQLALAFNIDSSVLAAGGEDGKLRVFKWPSMESIFEEDKAHPSIKDLCFSPDGKFLISLGRGACRVWDVASSSAVATLAKENDEALVSCRFSQASDNSQVLYIAAIKGNFGSIQTWNTDSWKKMTSKKMPCENVASFDVSPDGKLLAIGTVQGDVIIVRANSMRVLSTIKKAHIGIVTTVSFSRDSRALVSASMDSSARVTLVDTKGSSGDGGGLSLWIIILVLLLAVAAYFTKNQGLLPYLTKQYLHYLQ